MRFVVTVNGIIVSSQCGAHDRNIFESLCHMAYGGAPTLVHPVACLRSPSLYAGRNGKEGVGVGVNEEGYEGHCKPRFSR